MILERNGAIAICLPEAPTPREAFASQELEKYLSHCLDTHLVEAENADVIFYIGGPGRNPMTSQWIGNEAFSSALTGAEGIFIRICGNKVLLAGSEGFDDWERGTVYAVYEFLERYIGCTLAAYSAPGVEAGEIVPRLEKLELSDSQYVKAGADRPYRCAIVEYGDRAGNPRHELNIPFFDWLVKNRYNRILTWTSIYEGYKEMGLVAELEKRGINLCVGHHDAVGLWLPFYGNRYFPEQYAYTHPEYYRLNSDGTRFQPKTPDSPQGQWVFCSRNMECIEQISQNLIRWISENPLVDMVALWPMDGTMEQCCCEKCSPYSKIENYAYFQNEVAKRVSAVHPQIKIDMLLYTDLWTCPDDLELSPALMCDLSTWAATGLRTCGKPDGSCLIGTVYDETLLQWQKRGAQVVFYDYYMGVFGGRQRLIPMADELQSIWKYFKEKDIAGAGTQIECFNLWNHLMNLYSFGRTGYDAELSFEDNLSALCRLFGNGAPYIAQIVRLMEQSMDGQVSIERGGKYLMDNIDKPLVYDLFAQALAAAEEAVFRNNVRLMRMAFRYSDVETSDPGHRQRYAWVLEYEDPTGELAYQATRFDSFYHSTAGYGIAFPVANTDTKSFQPDIWYSFD